VVSLAGPTESLLLFKPRKPSLTVVSQLGLWVVLKSIKCGKTMLMDLLVASAPKEFQLGGCVEGWAGGAQGGGGSHWLTAHSVEQHNS
jgi:hypothetical protein